jgi:hypothetical protein
VPFWRRVVVSEGRRSTECVDCMRLPPGWMTVMDTWLVAADIVVDGIKSDLDATESMNAVVGKLGGLAQPGL